VRLRQAVPFKGWYTYGLGSNNILNQMNVAAATRATLDGDRAEMVVDRKWCITLTLMRPTSCTSARRRGCPSHADRNSARPKDATNPAARWKFLGSLQKKMLFRKPVVHCHRLTGQFLISGGPALKALRKARSRCLDQLPVFELALQKRGRTSWRWCVCTTEGDVVMQGSERSRPAAKYKAHGALFLLLSSAPYRSIQHGTAWRPQYGRGLDG